MTNAWLDFLVLRLRFLTIFVQNIWCWGIQDTILHKRHNRRMKKPIWHFHEIRANFTICVRYGPTLSISNNQHVRRASIYVFEFDVHVQYQYHRYYILHNTNMHTLMSTYLPRYVLAVISTNVSCIFASLLHTRIHLQRQRFESVRWREMVNLAIHFVDLPVHVTTEQYRIKLWLSTFHSIFRRNAIAKRQSAAFRSENRMFTSRAMQN